MDAPPQKNAEARNRGGAFNSRFTNIANSQELEDVYDLAEARHLHKPIGLIGSIAYAVKGALGSGVLNSHVSFKTGGVLVGLIFTPILGLMIGYCIYTFVTTAQVVYRRTRVPIMTYPDVGEAAFAIYPAHSVQALSRPFRYVIDTLLCLDLFCACACYHLILALTIKQIVEGKEGTSFSAVGASPHLRIYVLLSLPICIGATQVRKIKVLAPYSMLGNLIIFICALHTVSYAFINNPKFQGMVMTTDFYGFIAFCGMTIFSMSWSGVALFIESHMLEPERFNVVVVIGMIYIVLQELVTGFFGYAAYLDKSVAPITMNYPMGIWPHILKILVAIVMALTYSINFWVPFNMVFVYVREHVNPFQYIYWERWLRVFITCLICVIAILFPDIPTLNAMLGNLCMTHIVFVWPGIMYLLVYKVRPGYGRCQWRLFDGLFFISLGLALFGFGALFTFKGIQMLY